MKRSMTILKTFVCAALLMFVEANVATASLQTPKIKIQVLSELDKFEPFDAHVFHAGHLWAGRSRKDLGAFYRLEVFDGAGKSIASRELPHSLRHIVPHGTNGVLIVGIAAEPNQSFYSIATISGQALTIKSAGIPISAFADRGVGHAGQLYFTDPGGFDDGGPIGQPLKTIFTLRGSTPHYLNARIRGPQHTIPVGNDLFVVENESIATGGTNIVRVDVGKGTIKRLFTEKRNSINNMILLPKAGVLAVSENRASSVLLVDPRTEQITATIPVPAGDPRGLAEYGHCLVVASDNPRQVSFIDLKAAGHPVVSQWDLTVAGAKLLRIRGLAVNPQSGKVYARSSVACSPVSDCPAERNSVVMAEEEGTSTAAACN